MIRVRSVKVDGTLYRNKMVLVCHFEDGMPVFGEIKHIIVTHSKEVLFILLPLISVQLNRHYHAYEVLPVPSKVLVYHPHELADYHPLTTSKSHSSVDHSTYVCMKYFVCGVDEI